MGKDAFFERLFSSISESYKNDQHCDVRLYARGSRLDFALRPVTCHSLILCSVAPALTFVLNEVTADPSTGMKCVYLPDLNNTEVQKFIDDIYKGFSCDEFELNMSKDLATVFGIIRPDDAMDDDDACSDVYPSFTITDDLHDNVQGWEQKQTSPTAGRKGPVYDYPCSYKNCNKMFFNQNRRNVHILKSHKNTSRDCQICGLKVTNNLEVHKRLYHKCKDCKECNVTFSGVNAFQEHRRKVHSDLHNCQICNQKFVSKLKWLTHMRRSHDKKPDDDCLTPFACDCCPMMFKEKIEVLTHLKLDHSNKPFITKQLSQNEPSGNS